MDIIFQILIALGLLFSTENVDTGAAQDIFKKNEQLIEESTSEYQEILIWEDIEG